jgi:hypothetical protein
MRVHGMNDLLAIVRMFSNRHVHVIEALLPDTSKSSSASKQTRVNFIIVMPATLTVSIADQPARTN